MRAGASELGSGVARGRHSSLVVVKEPDERWQSTMERVLHSHKHIQHARASGVSSSWGRNNSKKRPKTRLCWFQPVRKTRILFSLSLAVSLSVCPPLLSLPVLRIMTTEGVELALGIHLWPLCACNDFINLNYPLYFLVMGLAVLQAVEDQRGEGRCAPLPRRVEGRPD